WDVLGIILQIGVHRHDVLAARLGEAGRHGRGLAEIAAESHQAQPGPRRSGLAQAQPGAVARAIVHDDDLARPYGLPHAFHRNVQRRNQTPDHLLLVVAGDHDGDLRLGHCSWYTIILQEIQRFQCRLCPPSMRETALRLLRCPNCRGELELYADRDRAADGHIMEGELGCKKGCRFEIVRGLPRLLPSGVAGECLATAARFGAEWQTFDHLGTYDEEWFKKWLEPVGPADFAGKTVFEGGCGKGRHTVIAAKWDVKDIVSVDLGIAAWVAFEHTRALENVHVAQGDLCHPPVAPGSFDLAYSVGVLHHLP